MQKKLKKIAVISIIIVVIAISFFLIYSAVNAFNRDMITLEDCDYISKDSSVSIWIRADYAFVKTTDNNISYKIKIVDNSMLEMTNNETSDYAIFIDNGKMLYLKSMRMYFLRSDKQ